MEKCPKCGRFMEEGWLFNGGTLFSRSKHHPFLFLEPGDVRIIPSKRKRQTETPVEKGAIS